MCPGRFVSWTFCNWTFGNWTFCILDVLYPGCSVTGLSVTGRFVTGRYVTGRFVGVPQQWQLFSSSMEDMPADRQPVGELIRAVAILLAMAAGLSSVSSIADMSSKLLYIAAVLLAWLVSHSQQLSFLLIGSPDLNIIIEVLYVTSQLFSWNYNIFSEWKFLPSWGSVRRMTFAPLQNSLSLDRSKSVLFSEFAWNLQITLYKGFLWELFSF